MATREEWTRLIDAAWDLALVEGDLRDVEGHEERYGANASGVARQILFERFGVR